jgi:hypothetical protein
MAINTIQHGTRNGYRHGCKDRYTCPGGSDGLKCIDAANQYNRDMRQAHRDARARRPVSRGNAGTKPGTGGIRVALGTPRPETGDTVNGQGAPDTWPSPDMPTFDPPDSLRNAEVPSDPEPAESRNDVYNDPEFIVTPTMKNDIAGKLGLFAAIIGMPFEAIDPYCGGIFAANVDGMINAYLPIITRSPGAVKFFMSKTGGWLDWIKALEATWPVVVAIYSHHLAKTVGASGNAKMPDATLPPQPADNFQYTAG